MNQGPDRNLTEFKQGKCAVLQWVQRSLDAVVQPGHRLVAKQLCRISFADGVILGSVRRAQLSRGKQSNLSSLFSASETAAGVP